jgi:hypothetical protein
MARQSNRFELPVPSPMGNLVVADARKEFAQLTKRTRRDRQAERAFLASKLHMVRTLPTDDLAARTRAVSGFLRTLRKTSARYFKAIIRHLPPTPGGVGYGMFYNAPIKTDFQTGTAIYWEIVCPHPPGGNVNTYLYLTATNRSAKGVEAFISYNGQNQTFFKVFDWARTDTWQTNVAFASLGNYLRTVSAHGTNYQVLPVMNITARTGNSWYNQVWLSNHVTNSLDLMYQYVYSATLTDQTTGWVGSWGPIIETFQDSYLNTNRFGALRTYLTSRDVNNQWGAWHLLGGSDAYVRVDNKGFCLVFDDPHHDWVAYS